jgi:hypothetical protein
LFAAVNNGLVFLDLDQTLNNELLQQLGVVRASSDNSTLGSGLGQKRCQEIVTDLHLLHAASTDFCRTRDALLNFVVLFLLGKDILDAEFGLVNQGLLFEVKVVLGLDINNLVFSKDFDCSEKTDGKTTLVRHFFSNTIIIIQQERIFF